MPSFVDGLSPALRGLIRQKRFTALAVASLGVAIALNTTMYSVTDAMLFPRVDMREPGNLYRLPFYGDYRQRLTLDVKRETVRGFSFLEDIAFRSPNFYATNLAENGALVKTANVVNVSTNYFTLLGVVPMTGRVLTDGDDNPARPVVVSERFWNQLFPDQPLRDSSTFTLDGEPRTVVGILAYGSTFPGEVTDVWQILPGAGSAAQLQTFVFNVARLKPNATVHEAYLEMDQAALRLEALAGDGPKNARFELEPIIKGPLRIENFHKAIIGAVLFVLLVACFNLANLQLARGLNRTREMATRAAVGATRSDLVKLLVSESAWIAGLGLALGIGLTFWGMWFVKSQIPPTLEAFLVRPQVSWRLFAFATVTTALALAIVGLFPAVRVSRVDVNELLKSGAGTGQTRRTRWQAGSLVVLQVGLALALMAGASLLIRAAVSLYRVEINPLLEKVVTASMFVRPSGPADKRLMRDVMGVAATRAWAVPGVVAASSSRSSTPAHKVISVTQPGALPREIPTGFWGYQFVTDGYLHLYGMTILKGRDFSPGENSQSVITDEGTARFLWPGLDPIGQQVKFGSDNRRDKGGWFTVIGVAKYQNTWASFRRANQSERYEPRLGAMWVHISGDTARAWTGLSGQNRPRTAGFGVQVRGTDNLTRLPMLLRRSVTDESAGLGVFYAQQLRSALQLDATRKMQDFVAALFTSFALLALGLASLGVYAVVSHTVSQRTREIGVRVALGASEGQIRQSVLEHGNVLALSGIAVGLVIAWFTVDNLSRFTLGGETSDVMLFAIAAVTLFAATLLASYLPARRAMRINPVEALRHE